VGFVSEKIEGTFFLDGLIEGRLPAEPDAEENLRRWVRSAGREHLKFSLDIDGGNFSLLPSTTPVSVDDLLESPPHAVQHAVENLMELIPFPERPGVQSTLRSTEYREKLEVQTLYLIAPDGTVQTRRRNLEARTTPPPRPIPLKEKLKLAGFGLVVVLALIGVSTFFVDYRALYHDIVEQVTPLDPTKIEVRSDAFAGLFRVTKAVLDSKQKVLVLTVRRETTFPADLAEACREEPDLRRRMALEALLKGYAHGEQFDEKGECVGFSTVRIAPLQTGDEANLVLPLPRDARTARIVIGL
jgi:hypothetical protein